MFICTDCKLIKPFYAKNRCRACWSKHRYAINNNNGKTVIKNKKRRWYNHGSYKWYCDDCKRDIGDDDFNKRDWEKNYQPRYGHPMFETREMMDKREEERKAR